MCGDINDARGVEEICSVQSDVAPPDASAFNLFIDDNLLIDWPLCGRRYTWFKANGISMSRIDQVLLIEE